jgi:hypothetical protein
MMDEIETGEISDNTVTTRTPETTEITDSVYKNLSTQPTGDTLGGTKNKPGDSSPTATEATVVDTDSIPIIDFTQ